MRLSSALLSPTGRAPAFYVARQMVTCALRWAGLMQTLAAEKHGYPLGRFVHHVVALNQRQPYGVADGKRAASLCDASTVEPHVDFARPFAARDKFASAGVMGAAVVGIARLTGNDFGLGFAHGFTQRINRTRPPISLE